MSVELFEKKNFEGDNVLIKYGNFDREFFNEIIPKIGSLIIYPKSEIILYSGEHFNCDNEILRNNFENDKVKIKDLEKLFSKEIQSIKVNEAKKSEIRNICEIGKDFKYVIYLQVEDITRTPVGKSFSVLLDINIHDEMVTISIPAMNFIISNSNGSGYIFTSKGNLPRKTWPVDPVYQSYTLQTDNPGVELDLYIANDGSFRIVASGNIPIAPGSYFVHAKTIEYRLPEINKLNVPFDCKLSEGKSSVIKIEKSTGSTNDFLDYYNNDFVKDVVAFSWADNHKGHHPYNLNLVTRVGKIKRNPDGTFRMDLHKPVTVIKPPRAAKIIRCYENTISINPRNTKNLVVTTIYQDNNQPVPGTNLFQLWRAVSYNRGKSWPVVGRVDNLGSLPLFRSNPNGMFDKFGNYWLVYMSSNNTLLPPFNLVFAVSYDKGATFNLVSILTPGLNMLYDYPRIAFGGDGNNGFALWASADLIDLSAQTVSIAVGYIPVIKFGNVGLLNMVPVPAIPTNFVAAPEITATKDGTVFLAAENFVLTGDNGKNAQVYLFALFGGIANFPNFIQKGEIFYSNVGSNDLNTSAGGKPLPFQPLRGCFPLGARGLDYDDGRKRLWSLGVDMKPDLSNNMDIFLMYSDNDGHTWSRPIVLNAISEHDRALPSLKVNEETGDIAIGWYDSRDSEHNKSVDYYATLFPASRIPKFHQELEEKEDGFRNINARVIYTNKITKQRGRFVNKLAQLK